MPHDRFFISALLEKNHLVEIKGSEHTHLYRVMRKNKGDIVELFDGKGILAEAAIEQIDEKRAHLKIRKITHQDPQKIKTTLLQALCPLGKIELIVEKATELGIDEIIFFPAEKSLKDQIKQTQIDRINIITISACKQSGRLFLPYISFIPSLEKHIFSNVFLFGDVRVNAPFMKDIVQNAKGNISICIGPEAGFTEKEVLFLENKKAVGVKISHNILRAETASIAAVAILKHLTE